MTHITSIAWWCLWRICIGSWGWRREGGWRGGPVIFLVFLYCEFFQSSLHIVRRQKLHVKCICTTTNWINGTKWGIRQLPHERVQQVNLWRSLYRFIMLPFPSHSAESFIMLRKWFFSEALTSKRIVWALPSDAEGSRKITPRYIWCIVLTSRVRRSTQAWRVSVDYMITQHAIVERSVSKCSHEVKYGSGALVLCAGLALLHCRWEKMCYSRNMTARQKVQLPLFSRAPARTSGVCRPVTARISQVHPSVASRIRYWCSPLLHFHVIDGLQLQSTS